MVRCVPCAGSMCNPVCCCHIIPLQVLSYICLLCAYLAGPLAAPARFSVVLGDLLAWQSPWLQTPQIVLPVSAGGADPGRELSVPCFLEV